MKRPVLARLLLIWATIVRMAARQNKLTSLTMSTQNGLRKNSASKTAATRTADGTTITPRANDHLADDPHLGIQDQREVLTAVELGKILRIHPVTVRLKAASGEIPGLQLGNRWRFSRTRINEWLMAA